LELPQGAEVNVDGPFGNFVLPESSEKAIVFIAGGIGVTPFVSMLRFANENKLSHNITLIYTNSSAERAAYLEELRQLAQENPQFTLLDRLQRVDREFVKQGIGEVVGKAFYISGTSRMVADTRKMLLEIGVSESDILIEEFTGYGVSSSPAASNIKNGTLSSRESALIQALNGSALVAETNIKGDISYANDTFVEISKYSREELLGQNHRILKSGFHSPGFYKNLWKTISSGEIWRGELKNRAKDGSFYWVDTSIAPVKGKNGKIERYIAIRFPITEKKEAETLLERASQVFNLMPSGALIYRLEIVDDDSSLILVDYNKGAEIVTGLDLSGSKGKRIDEVFPNLREQGIPQIYAEVVRSNRPKDLGEVLYGDKRIKETWFSVKAFPIPNQQVAILFDDITKEKEANLALQKEKESVEEKVNQRTADLKKSQQKVTGLNQLLKLINKTLRHDILNDLSIASGNIDTYLEYKNKADIDEVFKSVKESMDRGINYIHKMKDLELAFTEGEVLELCNVRSKALDVSKTFKEIVVNVDGDAQVMSDGACEVVFKNLFRNAIDHGGANKIDVSVHKDNMGLTIKVADNGKGVPDEVKKQLFQEGAKFGEHGHTGLGLYIIRKMIERYGGKIRVEDSEPRGTAFVIEIPN